MSLAASSSLISTLLRPNVGASSDLVYRGTDLFEYLGRRGRVRDAMGGSPFKWPIVYGSNTAEVFTEGAAPPSASEHSSAMASLAAFYVRNTVGITGHQRDNVAKGAFYEDPMALAKLLSQADLFYQLETQLTGSTQDRGISAIVDSTGTYAGLAQGTYAQWASEENAVSGAQTLAQLHTLYFELIADSVSSVNRGHMPKEILSDVNQINNYVGLMDGRATTGSVLRVDPTNGPVDGGFARPGMVSFMGMPWVPCRLIADTEVYMVDVDDFELLIQRDLRADPVIGNPELEQVQLSFAAALKVAHRNWHGKQTGVTA